MKRLIIIGTRKTGTSLEMVNSALRRGVDVTIISNPDDRIEGVFPRDVEIKYIPSDVAKISGWIKSQYPAFKGDIRITTLNDVYACISSRVNEELNLPGPDATSVSRAVSKFEQKNIFAENNIPTSGYSEILMSEQAGLDDILNSLHLPVVVKPSEGTASNGVKLCQTYFEVCHHIEYLTEQKQQRPDLIPSDILLIEEYLPGTEYCVEFFDGHYVGAMRKIKRYGSDFYERGYTSELDADETTLLNIIEVGTRAVEVAGVNWGPVHIDCIVNNGHASIIEINPRIAGSFICDIIRDAYGFNMVENLLDKLQEKKVTIPENFQPDTYACVNFFLESDPPQWEVTEKGEMKNQFMHISYGPQHLSNRRRRAYTYVRTIKQTVKPETN
ncbi:TPA: ATP-grasp domain-containing protein [Klebsiella pneumoniae]